MVGITVGSGVETESVGTITGSLVGVGIEIVGKTMGVCVGKTNVAPITGVDVFTGKGVLVGGKTVAMITLVGVAVGIGGFVGTAVLVGHGVWVGIRVLVGTAVFVGIGV